MSTMNERGYSIGLYEKAMPDYLSWEEKLRTAKDTGYDFVELSIDQTEEKISRLYWTKEERFDIIKAMYRAGLPIRSMCVSALTKYSLGNEDDRVSARGMEILKRAIALADDLGVRVVMIPGYDVYYEPSNLTTKKRFLKNLKAAAKIDEKTGVILGLETMENEFMNTVEKAMKYVVLCNSNYVKIYPDIGNLTNAAMQYQMDVLEDLELGKGNMLSMHLKETVPDKYRGVPYGTGNVDFQSAIRMAWNLGIRRYVTEFWARDRKDWIADIENAYQMMTGFLEELDRGQSKPGI